MADPSAKQLCELVAELSSDQNLTLVLSALKPETVVSWAGGHRRATQSAIEIPLNAELE
ncbi:hypothetical protein KNJ79_09020 [Sphingopyxis indica]|uniref:hypothetical protein n=1 Tax=Sphingopyxis indica TaxID=436663 RepID=UPI0029393DA8|nr:hypothetical protein [Sphingopyxis indica]WOF44995.1 hypothetical protein KNJ79_09020 [Sphingopyxis indica]